MCVCVCLCVCVYIIYISISIYLSIYLSISISDSSPKDWVKHFPPDDVWKCLLVCTFTRLGSCHSSILKDQLWYSNFKSRPLSFQLRCLK